jgi:hypothetical protein
MTMVFLIVISSLLVYIATSIADEVIGFGILWVIVVSGRVALVELPWMKW